MDPNQSNPSPAAPFGLSPIPFHNLLILRLHLFQARPMYRQTALIEAVEDQDLEVFPSDLVDRIKGSLSAPTSPVAQAGPLGGRADQAVFVPPLSPSELELHLRLEAEKLAEKVRGRMMNSASLVQEMVPINFRLEGQRGERLLTRTEEQTSWENIREVRTSRSRTLEPDQSPGRITESETHSFGRRPVKREGESLSRMIWDPQPFLVVIQERDLPPWLAGSRVVLQLRAVKVETKGKAAVMTPIPFGNLELEGPWIDVRGCLKLSDLQNWPTPERLRALLGENWPQPLPGKIAIGEILDAMEDMTTHGEEMLWWEAILPTEE